MKQIGHVVDIKPMQGGELIIFEEIIKVAKKTISDPNCTNVAQLNGCINYVENMVLGSLSSKDFKYTWLAHLCKAIADSGTQDWDITGALTLDEDNNLMVECR